MLIDIQEEEEEDEESDEESGAESDDKLDDYEQQITSVPRHINILILKASFSGRFLR